MHIPFCVRKCPYCDFNSYAVGSDEPALAEAYVAAVVRELEYYFLKRWEGRALHTIFFGGGTPSLLSPKLLGRILEAIRAHTSLTEETEITLEANPGTVYEEVGFEKLAALRELGWNRISFGSQSFSQRKLELLGRIHKPEDTIRAVENARRAGFKRLNLDVIYGVKNETGEELEEDLRLTLALSPEHISAYTLTIEPGTDFGKLAKKGVIFAESDDRQADFFERTQEYLSKGGFSHYEVSNYSLPGEECLHNLHYWKRGEYLGIGAGAHGFLSSSDTPTSDTPTSVRWSNIPKPEHYIQRVAEKGFGHHAEETISASQAEAEFVSLALRTSYGIDVPTFEERFKGPFSTKFEAPLSWALDNHLIEVGETNVRANRRGLLFLNSLIERFARVILA